MERKSHTQTHTHRETRWRSGALCCVVVLPTISALHAGPAAASTPPFSLHLRLLAAGAAGLLHFVEEKEEEEAFFLLLPETRINNSVEECDHRINSQKPNGKHIRAASSFYDVVIHSDCSGFHIFLPLASAVKAPFCNYPAKCN